MNWKIKKILMLSFRIINKRNTKKKFPISNNNYLSYHRNKVMIMRAMNKQKNVKLKYRYKVNKLKDLDSRLQNKKLG